MYRKSKEAMSLAAVSAAALALASCSGRTEAVKPNIIVFLVDDMGLMDTSVPFLTDSVGRPVRHALNSWYRTPNMQRAGRPGCAFLPVLRSECELPFAREPDDRPECDTPRGDQLDIFRIE